MGDFQRLSYFGEAVLRNNAIAAFAAAPEAIAQKSGLGTGRNRFICVYLWFKIHALVFLQEI